MSSGEYDTFMHLFKDYTQHLMKNEGSLLARIYGVFTVKIEKLAPVHLIMMGNTVKCKYMTSNQLHSHVERHETKIHV